MAAISSLQIGGVTYDIYAKSAEQAPGSSHELSSHSHFSTYFNGTSANSALTSKSALSAGSAAKAASATSALTAGSADKVRLISLDNASNYQVILGATGTQNLYYDSDLKIQYNTSSNTFYSPNISATNISGNTISAGKLTGTQFVLVSASATEANITAANATGVNAINNPKIGFWNSAASQKGYIIWTDYNNSNTWVNADSAFYGGAALSDGFVVTSDQLNSILVSKNLSATNFKAPKISATNLTATNIVGTLNREYTSFTNGTAKVTDDTRWMWVCRLKGVTSNTYQHISILLNNSFWNTQQANSILLTFMYGRNGGQGDTVSVHCDRVSFIQKNTDLEFKYVKNPSDTITSNTVDIYIRVSSAGNSYGHWAAKVLNHGENIISNLVEWKWQFNQTLPNGALDIPLGGGVANAATASYATSAGAAPFISHTISSHSDSANFFTGNSAKSACSATSAKNAGTATSAGTAANVNASQWNADSSRYILFGENKTSTTVGYDSNLTYNPSSNTLCAVNISSTNITATTFSGNLSGSARSALTSQYAVSAGAAPVASHNHGTLQSNFTKLLVNDSSVSTWSGQFGVLNDGYWLYTVRGQQNTPSWFAPNFAAGIAFGGYDTKGVISVQYDSPKIKIAGGNGKTSAGAPVWWIGLNGTNGKTYTLPGDTSTLAATNGSYTALSAGYASSTNTAQTMKSALSAGTAEKVQMQAKSDNTWYQSLFASTSTSSIWYDSDAKVQYNPSSNTFSATNLYGTTVSGATISGTNITAATTVRGTNIRGTNISGATSSIAIDTLITNAGRTIGNGKLTITTGDTTATGTFSA